MTSYDFEVVQGNCLPIRIIWKAGDPSAPVDLTGYAAELAVIADGTSLTLTSATGGLSLGGAAGTIEGELTAAQTSQLRQGRLNRYELRVTEPTNCLRTILEGFITAQFSAIESSP